jgi:hypothetical protein
MYVEVFLVEVENDDRPMLAVAPAFSIIKEGDLVVLEGEGQAFRRAITDSITIDESSAEYRLLEKATSRGKAFKVYGKYRMTEMDWEGKKDE